jgi:hypothetical protein
MSETLGELITLQSTKGVALDGIMFRREENEITIIHIHGSFGNFYQNQFIRDMASIYQGAGINLLSINLAGHDGLAEGYKWGKNFEYVGGAIADFNECLADIQGVVNFASRFSNRLILQGHSLGCDRVLHFLVSTEARYDFILLSPCDSYQLQVNWIAPETVEEQIRRLKAQAPSDPMFDWLPSREYGVKGRGDWTYAIPVTCKALLSIMEGPAYRLMRIASPASFHLDQDCLIYIGGKDALQVWPDETMFSYFEERVKRVKRLFVPRGDHSLADCEQEVIRGIVQWVFSET